MTTTKKREYPIGECSMCHLQRPIFFKKRRLCSNCHAFLTGRIKSWLGTCEFCGARPVRFTTDIPICDTCRENGRTGTLLDTPDTQALIQLMRQPKEPKMVVNITQRNKAYEHIIDQINVMVEEAADHMPATRINPLYINAYRASLLELRSYIEQDMQPPAPMKGGANDHNSTTANR